MAQRTYNEHFRLYYNSDQQSWAKKPQIEVDIQITEHVAADIEDLSDIEVKLYYCHVTAYSIPPPPPAAAVGTGMYLSINLRSSRHAKYSSGINKTFS